MKFNKHIRKKKSFKEPLGRRSFRGELNLTVKMKERKVFNVQAKQKMKVFKRILLAGRKSWRNDPDVTQRGLRVELRS